jgi:hypothetical protein
MMVRYSQPIALAQFREAYQVAVVGPKFRVVHNLVRGADEIADNLKFRSGLAEISSIVPLRRGYFRPGTPCLACSLDNSESWTPGTTKSLVFPGVERGSGGPKGHQSLAQGSPRGRVLR